MQGQMDLFNPPDMHIVNVCGELREAPSWMHYGWCKETIQRSQATSYCMKFEDKNDWRQCND